MAAIVNRAGRIGGCQSVNAPGAPHLSCRWRVVEAPGRSRGPLPPSPDGRRLGAEALAAARVTAAWRRRRRLLLPRRMQASADGSTAHPQVVHCEHLPCFGGEACFDAGAALLPPIAERAARMERALWPGRASPS